MKRAMTSLILVAALGCNGRDGGAGDGVQAGPEDDTVDADGDGYPADVDCDDEDWTIHPGVGELCDGVDENCDGQIDEDAINATGWYADADEDGFGDEDGFVERSCEAPDGTVDDATDCDDGDAAVNPDADEVCNDIDDNCDGVVDSDAIDRLEWYVDADGDGWGTGEPSTPQCGPIDGYADQDGDCNDADPEINPGTAEVVGDRIDNNCDGKSNGIWGEIELGEADCRYYGEALGDTLGAYVAPAGDWSGDGLADVLVSSFNSSRGAASAGAVGVILGPCSGVATWSDAATAILVGTQRDARAGAGIAGLGDIDGDGYDDVLVGAFWDDTADTDAGAAYIVHGGGSGEMAPNDTEARWYGESALDRAGLYEAG